MQHDDPEVKAAMAQLGYTALRPMQIEVVDATLRGDDVVAVLPTSAGKSCTYQLPALAQGGLTLVISPLIALMIDQVDALQKKGVAAAALHTHTTAAQKKRTLEGIKDGSLRLLYVSPERLQGLGAEFFAGSTLRRIAVDEAHCISEWGHDFRPAYLRVGRNLRRLVRAMRTPVPILALTATATGEVIDEIAALLADPERPMTRIVNSPERTNLYYSVAGEAVDLLRMIGHADERVGLPALVYGATRQGVERAAEELKRAGYRTQAYHAGLGGELRQQIQAQFAAGDLDVICATCAFGMGIDNRRLRAVLHTEMSTSLEAYIQEAGRAGRDGAPSLAICRATEETLDTARKLIPSTWPSPERVLRFWARLRPHFWSEEHNVEGEAEGQRALSTMDLVRWTAYDEMEAASCMRILVDSGFFSRLGSAERPCRVVLLQGHRDVRGVRQREVLDALDEWAGPDGEVTGTKAFFRDRIGADKAMIDALVVHGAVRAIWAEEGTLYRQVQDRPALDETRLRTIARRQVDRVEAARGYLYSPGCRRAYLLRYFGDDFLAEADPKMCCDRCRLGYGRKAP